jgi:hypothetical protein
MGASCAGLFDIKRHTLLDIARYTRRRRRHLHSSNFLHKDPTPLLMSCFIIWKGVLLGRKLWATSHTDSDKESLLRAQKVQNENRSKTQMLRRG